MQSPLLKKLAGRLGASPYRGSKRLVLAVSGGLDSITLLDVFVALQHVHGASLEVCHVHHGTGAFADQSEALVREAAAAYGLACRVVAFEASATDNFEYEAAKFRHRVLAEGLAGDEYAVLAHHRRDQAETILMTLTRGAGIATPLGMAEMHGHLLRPLLDVSRDEILTHAKLVGLRWLEDPTNNDTSRFRNAVRLQVLPVLESFHGNCERLMTGFADDWRQLHQSLETAAQQEFDAHYDAAEKVLKRAVFEQGRDYLWPFLLRLLWQRLGVSPPIRRDAEQLRRWLLTGQTGRLQHAAGWLYCDLDGVTMVADWDRDHIQSARLGEIVEWNGWQICLVGIKPALDVGPLLREEGFQLVKSARQPRAARDRLRQDRVPMRARDGVPDVLIGKERYTLYQVLQWQKQGLCDWEITTTGAFAKLLHSFLRKWQGTP